MLRVTFPTFPTVSEVLLVSFSPTKETLSTLRAWTQVLAGKWRRNLLLDLNCLVESGVRRHNHVKYQLHSLTSAARIRRIYQLGRIKTVTLKNYFLGKNNDSLDILVLALRDIYRALFSDYGSFLNILLWIYEFFQVFLESIYTLSNFPS